MSHYSCYLIVDLHQPVWLLRLWVPFPHIMGCTQYNNVTKSVSDLQQLYCLLWWYSIVSLLTIAYLNIIVRPLSGLNLLKWDQNDCIRFSFELLRFDYWYRAQEQYRRLQDSNQPSEQYRLLQHYHGNQQSFDSDQSPPSNMTRADWIKYLRLEHQRKHRERQGQYPHEDKEESYEEEIQQSLDKPQVCHSF